MQTIPVDPFDAGERAMPARPGVRERLAQVGPRVIQEAMPEQHRAFFRQLQFVVAVGHVDAAGQPRASLPAGPPGFIDSADPKRFAVRSRPAAASPLAAVMRPGAAWSCWASSRTRADVIGPTARYPR